MTSPVFARIIAAAPFAFSLSQKPAVRRSCHTIALPTGFPVVLFQATVVSRWFVMPMAAMSFAVSFAFFNTSFAVRS